MVEKPANQRQPNFGGEEVITCEMLRNRDDRRARTSSSIFRGTPQHRRYLNTIFSTTRLHPLQDYSHTPYDHCIGHAYRHSAEDGHSRLLQSQTVCQFANRSESCHSPPYTKMPSSDIIACFACIYPTQTESTLFVCSQCDTFRSR